MEMKEHTGKSENEGRRKKPYQPPTLVAISLRPEEAVLGTCKNTSHSGPANPYCSYLPPGCYVIGS